MEQIRWLCQHLYFSKHVKIIIKKTNEHSEAIILTNEELVMKIQAGKTKLITELLRQVERFIIKHANRFFCTYRLRCEQFELTIEDLYQEGYFAIYKSIEMFKAEKDCKFLTYIVSQFITMFMALLIVMQILIQHLCF